MRIFKPRPRYKINYNAVADHLGVKLRGNETFTELLEIEKQVKEYKSFIERYAGNEKALVALGGQIAMNYILNKINNEFDVYKKEKK